MRLVITGTACTGKSTLSRQLAERRGWEYIPENYESLFDKHGKYIQPRSELAIQIDRVLVNKWKLEKLHKNTVSDRCSIDLFNLWLSLGFSENKQVAEFAKKCRGYQRYYDAFVILPWGVLPMQQVNESNGMHKRNMNPWAQFHRNATLIGLIMQWVPSSKRIFMPAKIINLDERIDYVLAFLEKQAKE
ncbi:MAG: AAA family ATPase [Methylococcales bacterium]|nr:AAA family ATPase [Methylococcales bacterium]